MRGRRWGSTGHPGNDRQEIALVRSEWYPLRGPLSIQTCCHSDIDFFFFKDSFFFLAFYAFIDRTVD